jgi:hypothetical protein
MQRLVGYVLDELSSGAHAYYSDPLALFCLGHPFFLIRSSNDIDVALLGHRETTRCFETD